MKQQSENQQIEFKSLWKDDYLKQVCGFANSIGGILYIGIDDKGTIVGIKNSKKLLEDIPSKIITQLAIYPKINVHASSDKEYLSIQIEREEEPISFKGKFYVRSGSTTQELNGFKLQDFLLRKHNLTWDDVGVVGATLEHIDPRTVKRFVEKAILANRISPDARDYDIQTLFENLNLFDKNGTVKRAAILVFGKDPMRFFPTASYKIGRFISETDIVVQDVIEDNLFTTAENVITLLKSKYLKAFIRYQGIQRIEELEYPERALREAVLNAIVHKDYCGSYIQMRVYNHSLSLWNSGGLPEQIPIESLMGKHASIPRNRIIANLFFRAGYIEAWGRGMSIIFDECYKNNLPKPQVREEFGGFTIEFHQAKGDESASGNNLVPENAPENVPENAPENRLESIIELIKLDPYISMLDLSKRIGVNHKTIKRDIEKLKTHGMLKRIGPANGGHWQIINS
jgi:ATP-dependent DNA helicase RecG